MREETGQKGPWQHSERVPSWRNPEHWRWPGPVLCEEQTPTQSTADQQLLESRGATD